jgi:hypothetical protein
LQELTKALAEEEGARAKLHESIEAQKKLKEEILNEMEKSMGG